MLTPGKTSSAPTRLKLHQTFKREAVANWLSSGKSATIIGEELGISPGRRAGRALCVEEALRPAPAISALKLELSYRRTFASQLQARTEIFDYIEEFYNGQRIHSALDYLTLRIRNQIQLTKSPFSLSDFSEQAHLQSECKP